MKKFARIISPLIVLVMVMTVLTGCGKKVTAESVFTEMTDKVNAIESATVNLKFDVAITAKAEGVEMPINATADLDFVTQETVAGMNGTMSYSLLGMEQSIPLDMYFQYSEDKTTITTYGKGAEDDEWSKSTLTNEENLDAELIKKVESLTSADILDLMGGTLVLDEELVKVNDKDCYKLSGKLNLKTAYDFIISKLGDEVLPTADAEFDPEILAKADIPFVATVYKDDMLPATYEINLADTLANYSEDINALMGEGGALSFDTLKITASYSDYNNTSVEIPKEALEAKEDPEFSIISEDIGSNLGM